MKHLITPTLDYRPGLAQPVPLFPAEHALGDHDNIKRRAETKELKVQDRTAMIHEKSQYACLTLTAPPCQYVIHFALIIFL